MDFYLDYLIISKLSHSSSEYVCYSYSDYCNSDSNYSYSRYGNSMMYELGVINFMNSTFLKFYFVNY